MICQTDEHSLFWPLLPLYSVGTISYLFKVYGEVSWYQQEINHERLLHPNERNNLVVAFDLYEDEGWRMKRLSRMKNISLFSNIMLEKYERSLTKTVWEIWMCCKLTQATCATLDILGLATPRRWRNRNLRGWCNEVRTLRRSSGGACRGGGGLSAWFYIIYAMSPLAKCAVSSTKRWVCTGIVRCNKLDCFPQTQKTDYSAQSCWLLSCFTLLFESRQAEPSREPVQNFTSEIPNVLFTNKM